MTPRLTPRETAVLHARTAGATYREIGGRLGVSEHTVRTHLAHIREKLGARNTTQAVVIAYKEGLLT